MPRGDGTGPPFQGGGQKRGARTGGGRGRGRMGGFAAGPGGNCVCPSCGKVVPHQRGVPCSSLECPSCGSPMTRSM
jgi:hypothetical protein